MHPPVCVQANKYEKSKRAKAALVPQLRALSLIPPAVSKMTRLSNVIPSSLLHSSERGVVAALEQTMALQGRVF